MAETTFSTEQLLEYARTNVMTILLSHIAYAAKTGQSFADWVRFTGEMFAPSWDDARGKGALEVARSAALNVSSGGATDVSLSGDDERAEVSFVWPSEALLSEANVSRADAASFLHVFEPITARLGLRYEQSQEGNRTRCVFSR